MTYYQKATVNTAKCECYLCGSTNAVQVIDPYLMEMDNIESIVPMCEECFNTECEEI